MLDDVQKALKTRYSHIHSLIFLRSLERVVTNGQLFDVLETIPEEYPIIWNQNALKWETTDLLQSKRFNRGEKK
jgi:hypothetical protein